MSTDSGLGSHEAEPFDDPSSPMEMHPHEMKKAACVNLVKHEANKHEAFVQSMDAKAKRKSNGVCTNGECMATYKQQLDALLKRLHKTTTEVEGKDEFRDDIDQIESDMKLVLQHGWQHIKDLLHFPRFDEARVSPLLSSNKRARRTRSSSRQ